MIDTVSLWGNIFAGQSIAFSLCILMIGRMDRHKLLWLTSNLVGSIGLYVVTHSSALIAGQLGMNGAYMVIMSGMVKAFALLEGRLSFRRNRITVISAAVGLLIGAVGYVVPFDYRLLTITVAGVCVNLACISALIPARRWRGSWASWLMVMALVVAVVGNNFRVITAYPIGVDRTFMGQTDLQFLSVFAVITLSFFMQVAFIGMLHARETRVIMLANRRAARINERALVLKLAKQETDKLAAERLTMLQLLTHEVRQPINNAQAALQAVMMQLAEEQPKPETIRKVVRRTERVLDDITLTLSNAITGATLLERHGIVSLEPVEITGICRLAIMDCPTHDHHRIKFHHPDHEIFAHCDPVLLRLALRNLLDNAVKYSPHSSPVNLTVCYDDEAFGLRFTVQNRMADLRSLQGNIFERGKRGVDRAYEGFGLGLFVISETARLHFGELNYYQASPDEVTFEMFLPL